MFFAFSFAQTLGGILYPHLSKRAVSLHLPPTSLLSLLGLDNFLGWILRYGWWRWNRMPGFFLDWYWRMTDVCMIVWRNEVNDNGTKTSIELGCMDMLMWLLANRRIYVLMHGIGPKIFGWMKRLVEHIGAHKWIGLRRSFRIISWWRFDSMAHSGRGSRSN